MDKPLKNEKRVSSHTVDAYYRDINSFIHFLIEHIGGPLSLRNLETLIASDFRAFMARKKRDGNSTRTIARLMSSIRSLFEYFEKIEIIKNNAINNIRMPKLPQSIPKPLTYEQAKDLIIDTQILILMRSLQIGSKLEINVFFFCCMDVASE